MKHLKLFYLSILLKQKFKNNLINSEIKSFSSKEFSAIGAGNQSLSVLFRYLKKVI